LKMQGVFGWEGQGNIQPSSFYALPHAGDCSLGLLLEVGDQLAVGCCQCLLGFYLGNDDLLCGKGLRWKEGRDTDALFCCFQKSIRFAYDRLG